MTVKDFHIVDSVKLFMCFMNGFTYKNNISLEFSCFRLKIKAISILSSYYFATKSLQSVLSIYCTKYKKRNKSQSVATTIAFSKEKILKFMTPIEEACQYFASFFFAFQSERQNVIAVETINQQSSHHHSFTKCNANVRLGQLCHCLYFYVQNSG